MMKERTASFSMYLSTVLNSMSLHHSSRERMCVACSEFSLPNIIVIRGLFRKVYQDNKLLNVKIRDFEKSFKTRVDACSQCSSFELLKHLQILRS